MKRTVLSVLAASMLVLPVQAAPASSELVQEALDACIRWRGPITQPAMSRELVAAKWSSTTTTLFTKTGPGGYVALTIAGEDARRSCRLFVRVDDTPWTTDPATETVRRWATRALPGAPKTVDRAVQVSGGPARAEQWKRGADGATLLMISRPTKQAEPSSDVIVSLEPGPAANP